MAWFYLAIAGLFETGWPIGLKLGNAGNGPRALPIGLAVLAMGLSGLFLYQAQRTIPMGTAYAVWTGIGTIGTFLVGVTYFREPANPARFVCIGLIAAGIVGFKLFDPTPVASDPSTSTKTPSPTGELP